MPATSEAALEEEKWDEWEQRPVGDSDQDVGPIEAADL